MSVRDEIHSQIVGGLVNGTSPINIPEELFGSFPYGATNTCRSGDLIVSAGDAGKLQKASDFPSKNAKQVADVIVERAGLQ
ncbi:MAG TPA: hypothetical protein C5S50_08535 [Methanosarcinaceae archaeon]|nr:hypothetical protein [Methanosarcinaceae archaeon]